jgi:hypothetical protein
MLTTRPMSSRHGSNRKVITGTPRHTSSRRRSLNFWHGSDYRLGDGHTHSDNALYAVGKPIRGQPKISRISPPRNRISGRPRIRWCWRARSHPGIGRAGTLGLIGQIAANIKPPLVRGNDLLGQPLARPSS